MYCSGSSGGLSIVLCEYNNCPQHRGVILSLSAIIQSLLIQCPAAFVWLQLGEAKQHSPLYGSPLDLLPCAPSSLPISPGPDTADIRRQLHAQEQQISLRSQASEIHWAAHKAHMSARGSNHSLSKQNQCSTINVQQSICDLSITTGYVINRVLTVLDILDRHNFDCVEMNGCMELLYNKIFPATHAKDTEVIHNIWLSVLIVSEAYSLSKDNVN